MEVIEMDKIRRFKKLAEKYLGYVTALYFVDSYVRIYEYLHNDGDGDSYEIDYGRLWGMFEVMRNRMKEDDEKELLDLIVTV